MSYWTLALGEPPNYKKSAVSVSVAVLDRKEVKKCRQPSYGVASERLHTSRRAPSRIQNHTEPPDELKWRTKAH